MKGITKLICFDLWETLVTEPSTFEYCWEPFASAYPDKISWPKIHLLIAQIAQRKDQSTEKSIQEILGNLNNKDANLITKISQRWNNSCDQVVIFPDALEVLDGLKEAGFKLGLITNTSRYGWEAIERKINLGIHFDYLALSFERGRVKPEPEMFEFIERQSGFLREEIVMVGDSYESDFKAPRKRGWGSILLDRKGTNKYPDAKPVIQGLLQLKNILL